MFRALLTLLLLLPALPALVQPARALESEAVASPRATVTLVSEVDTVVPGQPFRLGLRQRLADGWHTYWLNPGDAGQAPELAVTGPEGTATGPLVFPAPLRIPYGPLVNFGYEHAALFTLPVTPPASLRAGDRLVLEAEASWLVCAQLCIPEEGRFRLELPVAATARPGAEAPLFTAAEAAQAQPSPFATRIGFNGPAGAIEVAGPGLLAGAIRDAFFFPAMAGVLDHAAPQPLQVQDGLLRLGLRRGEAELPGRVDGVITILDAAGTRGAWEVSASPGAVPGGEALPLWQAMLFALLGGLILNIMPCVFPVLAMKAMALARLSGAARAEVRAHAASYTAGVVLSFLALGGLLLALRAAGGIAGWGFQFTSPIFVAGLAWLMLAVGLNLSGVYALGGPVGLGSGAAGRGGHLGSFCTGGLAVLVATPCTAPFMAAAIGAALAMPAAATLAVFAALGLGLALPYALLGLFPAAAAALPRPGAWMEALRQGLAFPMYGAAAWLTWVLAQQAGADGVLAALAGAVLVGFAAWALGQAQRAGIAGRRIAGGLAALSLAAALVLLFSLKTAPPAEAAGTGAEAWSEARIAALRAEGRPVFVNLTAAWCVTCKVNERVALQGAAVRQAFAAGNIAYLKGDWTNGDAAITALLRQHGRDGVPLYLFYPAGGGAPALLPQILTEGIVLRAIGAGS